MRQVDLAEKLRWVLRNARTHAADPSRRTAIGFAAAAGVHRSQVGRWENGTVDVTYELVRRYEETLHLPEGQLLAVIDVFNRTLLPRPTESALYPRDEPDVERTLELLERALGTERMTGLEWDHLSLNLDRMPHALIRATDWEHLIRRCNQEIAVSLELNFLQRYGAAARFVRHPRSAAIVTQIAADILRDPGAQIYADVASVLRFTTHPEAIAVLLGQLREPTNDHALRAAYLALTSLVAGGRLGREVTIEAVRLAVEHLRDLDRPFRVRRGAANLLRAVDLPGRERLAAGLSIDNQRFAASIIMEGHARAADELRELTSRVRRALEQALSPEEQHDPVLTTVLGAAIGEANEEINGAALAVLMLSPQGRVIGITYAAELDAALRRGDHVAAHECLSVLSWLMQPEVLDPLTDLACSRTAGAELAYDAANAVGNCSEAPGPARSARDLRLRDRLVAVLDDPADDASTEQQIRGLIYALGMRGRYDLIDLLAADLDTGELQVRTPAVGRTIQSSLSWWQDLPSQVRPQA